MTIPITLHHLSKPYPQNFIKTSRKDSKSDLAKSGPGYTHEVWSPGLTSVVSGDVHMKSKYTSQHHKLQYLEKIYSA